MSKDAVSRPGFDGCGIPISRTGNQLGTGTIGGPGEAWDSRGAGISRTTAKDGSKKEGTKKSPSIEPFATGRW